MKTFRYYLLGSVAAGIVSLVPQSLYSQGSGIPRQMSYQGVLREGDKVVADGTYSVVIALYDKATGAQPLWQETQSVEVKGGLFHIILGQNVSLPAPLPTEAWIGVNFNSTGEMPRTKLTSSAYSFNAVTAQSLTPNATGAVLSVNGQQGAIELRAADGFEVRSEKGVLTIGKTNQTKEEEILNQGTEWLLAGNGNATANSWLGTNNNNPLIVKTNNVERMRILSSNGNVGIGETSPTSRLSVARTLHITNTGGTPELRLSAPSGANSTTFRTTGQSSNITYTLPPTDGNADEVLMTDGSGVLTWVDNGWSREGNDNITANNFIGTTNQQPFIVKTNNIERYRVTSGGSIGINEDNPTQKLEVAGNILVKVDGNNTGEIRFQEPPGFMGNNYVGLKAGSVINNIVFTLPSSYPTQPGQVLSANSSGVMTWITPESGGSGSGLLYFAESRHTSSPNDGLPAHRFAAIGAEASIDVVLSPKGNGALMAQLPDNTDLGGIKRGNNSVDWQMNRYDSWQVASGFSSVIAGGYANEASGDFSVVSGGLENRNDGAVSAIAGGDGNFIGFDVSGGFIGGGVSNRVGGNESGTESSSIVGGSYNEVYGNNSMIMGGTGLILEGSGSFGFNANRFSEDESYTRDMIVNASNVGVLNNIDVWLTNNDGGPRSLRFYESYNNDGIFPNGAHYAALRAAATMAANVTWTLPDADGTSGQVLSTNGSGTLSWVTAGNGGGLQYFTEVRNTTAPNDVVPVHQFAASGAGADIDIALTPKGTGALTAQIADETATGGNKRGLYAVDWQMQRSTQEQVASGDNSVIGGGNANDARGEMSVVGGGNNNRNDGPTSVIAGGNGNFIGFDAGNAGILGGTANRVGGNEAGSNNSAVVGGRENEVYGNNSTILGGRGLTLNGSGNIGFLGNNNTGANDMVIMTTNTAAFANVDMWIVNNDNTAHELRIYEASGNGSNYTAFRAAAQTTNVTYTLPPGDGADGQTLTTNGTGQLSWQYSIPCGGIIMWTGNINAVPAGWALCDGTNGTPNLNDRFPRGTTNAANVGTQGGSDSHLHTVDDHNHTLSSVTASGTIDDGTVSGSIGTNTTGITASGTIDSGGDITTDGSNNFGSSVSVSVTDPGHDHTFIGSLNSTSVSVNLSGSTDTASGVGTSSSDNVPAYIYVGYIMKVCPVVP